MYSFEGKYRTTPNVSLGGRRKQDKIDKERLLRNAQLERQKREEVRRRLRSSVVIQSSVRSFLARQSMKRQLREEFDLKCSQTGTKDHKIEDLVVLSKQLKFFYDSKVDNDRLIWIGQRVIKDKKNWLTKDNESLYLTSELLKLSCRCLRSIDSSSNVTIPLRVIETFTDFTLLKKSKKWSAEDASKLTLQLWNGLVEKGYFQSILHLLTARVPSDFDYQGENVRPPTPLAETLLTLLVRPVVFVGNLKGTQEVSSEMEIEGSHNQSSSTIIESFVREVLLTHPTIQLYHYIFPALGQMQDFPVGLVTMVMHSVLTDDPPATSAALGSLAKIVHPKLDTVTESCLISYLGCVKCLLLRQPPTRYDDDDIDSDAEDSDDETERMDFDESTAHGLVPTMELIHDGCSSLSSHSFINALINRKIHESDADSVLDSISTICHLLIVVRKVNVQRHTLLRTLAFSPSFLKTLWNSTLNSKAVSRITGKRVPLVRLLIEGSPMSSDDCSLIQSKLVVFCSLFNLCLLAVHDADFYSKQSQHMAFPLLTIINITMLMRDVCLAMIKRTLPETRTRSGKYDIKAVLNALSTGHSLKLGDVGRIPESEVKEINNYIYLFNVCRRLVKHIHTRDSRQSFIQKGAWLSNSILIGQSFDLANRWQRRAARSNSVAAHLADSTDEDVILTINEARQLAVLVNLPFVVNFDTRVEVFVAMLQQDRSNRQSESELALSHAGFGPANVRHEVRVRRDYLYEDAFNDLSVENAPNFRKPLRASFINAMGLEEAGYGAGVTREFLQQVVKAGFDPKRGFFKSTAQGRLYPNPHAYELVENANEHFFFLGRILGKVVYESMQVELPFASFFLCKILQRKSTDVDINHLQSLDPDFYKNLMYLHEYDGDIADLELNFTVVDETLGVTKVTELIADGKNKAVTNENKDLYMHLLANYKLNVQMKGPCYHFRRGLEDVVNVDWLQMFNHEEFQTLVAGAEVPIDIDDLKANTVYSGGYSFEHPTISAFWDVLPSLTNGQLSQLLLFVTSCSRPPLLGFKDLNPPFCIQRGGSDDRLPTASTCVNLLKLPEYPDNETLKSKLLYCLQSQSGFELS